MPAERHAPRDFARTITRRSAEGTTALRSNPGPVRAHGCAPPGRRNATSGQASSTISTRRRFAACSTTKTRAALEASLLPLLRGARLTGLAGSGGHYLGMCGGIAGAIGVGQRPLLRPLEHEGALIWRHLAPLLKPLLPPREPLSALAVGALWSWLPCGLVYAELSVAATAGGAPAGALVMALFGLGTPVGLTTLSALLQALALALLHPAYKKAACQPLSKKRRAEARRRENQQQPLSEAHLQTHVETTTENVVVLGASHVGVAVTKQVARCTDRNRLYHQRHLVEQVVDTAAELELLVDRRAREQVEDAVGLRTRRRRRRIASGGLRTDRRQVPHIQAKAGLATRQVVAHRGVQLVLVLRTVVARAQRIAHVEHRLPGGILNLHPSLLPRHRGASPVPAAILAGDRETGVSTIVMDAGLDTGPLLNVQHSALRGDETSPELEARLADMAGAEIVTTMRRYLDGEIRPRPQSTDGVSLTRRLTRHDGFVHSGMGVEQAHRAWRAYRPWPGAWVSVPSMLDRLILDEVGAPIYDRATEPDRFDLLDGILVLGLRGGALPLLHVTPAGGRRMDGAALVRGRPELLSSRARIG